MDGGIVTLDLHGINVHQAEVCIDAALRRASRSTYRLRLIHGYRGGTGLRDMIRTRYRGYKKVLRIEVGLNPGETELVLREL